MTTKAELEQELATLRALLDEIAEIIDDDELTAMEQYDQIVALVATEQYDRDEESEDS